jgi:uncharacterized surface protein with fasciclin (FAS1) repeats
MITFRKLIAGVMLGALAVAAIAPAAVSAAGGKNIVERLDQRNQATGKFDTLLTAATCVDFRSDAGDPTTSAVYQLLVSDGPLTLFAPTDKAFDDFAGLTPANVCTAVDSVSVLLPILQFHVFEGKATYRDARNVARAGGSLPMANGADASISGKPGRLDIADARIVQRNMPANNGKIHVINAVMQAAG